MKQKNDIKIQTLLSCMNEMEFSIIERSNIKTDTIIINQCNSNKFEHIKKNNKSIHKYSTTDRGLSKSRNKALKMATGDYCIICDDDEKFESNYLDLINESIRQNPEYDILTFIVERNDKKYSKREKTINYLSSLKISSVQIVFKRKSIVENNISFNEKFGSGTEHYFGEENLFLFDCLKKKLKIKYIPVKIAKLIENNSKWFTGYNENYFYQKGYVNTELMGQFCGLIYCNYFLVRKYYLYKNRISFVRAYKNMMLGYKKNLMEHGEKIK